MYAYKNEHFTDCNKCSGDDCDTDGFMNHSGTMGENESFMNHIGTEGENESFSPGPFPFPDNNA